MARSPNLTGTLLNLVPFSAEHLAPRYVGWLNDADVTRYSEQARRRHTLESCREFAASFEESPNYFWAAVSADPELGHIGNLVAVIDTWSGLADVSIMIGEKRAWGRGYGREACALASGYLLGAGGMRKVAFGTLAVNVGMLSIMRALGMQDDGVRRAHAVHDGRPVDVVYAALFSDSHRAN